MSQDYIDTNTACIRYSKTPRYLAVRTVGSWLTNKETIHHHPSNSTFQCLYKWVHCHRLLRHRLTCPFPCLDADQPCPWGFVCLSQWCKMCCFKLTSVLHENMCCLNIRLVTIIQLTTKMSYLRMEGSQNCCLTHDAVAVFGLPCLW